MSWKTVWVIAADEGLLQTGLTLRQAMGSSLEPWLQTRCSLPRRNFIFPLSIQTICTAAVGSMRFAKLASMPVAF
jgi:hypothetical protein